MEITFFKTQALFRAWLKKNHAKKDELLVGYYKVNSGLPGITYPASVDEALCFGWIDGVRRNVDEKSYSIRFTPRRNGSIWSNVNIARVEKLIAEGKMMPAGLEAFNKRKPERMGVYSFEQGELLLTDEQEAIFRANKKAWTFFMNQPPWYRKAAIHWVVTAKKAETKTSRFRTLLADSAAGKTIGPLTRKNKK